MRPWYHKSAKGENVRWRRTLVHGSIVPGGHRQLCEPPAPTAAPSSRAASISCGNRHPRPQPHRPGQPPSVVRTRGHASVVPGSHRKLCESPATVPSLAAGGHRQLCVSPGHASLVPASHRQSCEHPASAQLLADHQPPDYNLCRPAGTQEFSVVCCELS